MNILRISAIALVILPGFTAQGIAAACTAASKAKPNMSFATPSKAPRGWRAGKIPPRLARGLAKLGTKRGRDTTHAEPFDTADAVCDDWIAICSNEDCTHGVLECDGDCIDF